MEEICTMEWSLTGLVTDRYLFAGTYFLGSIMYVLIHDQEKTVFGKFERNGSGELQTIQRNTGNLLIFIRYCSRHKKSSFLSYHMSFSYGTQLSMTGDWPLSLVLLNPLFLINHSVIPVIVFCLFLQ